MVTNIKTGVVLEEQALTCIEICHICLPDTHAAEIAQPAMRHATMKKVTLDPAHTAKPLRVTDEALWYKLQKRDPPCISAAKALRDRQVSEAQQRALLMQSKQCTSLTWSSACTCCRRLGAILLGLLAPTCDIAGSLEFKS